MKQKNSDTSDEKLSGLLRSSRPAPLLPPRFREGVWRRIEESEISATARVSWVDALVSWALRPRFAFATAIVLVAAGSIAGVRQGTQAAHQDVQTRYVVSVAPNSLR